MGQQANSHLSGTGLKHEKWPAAIWPKINYKKEEGYWEKSKENKTKMMQETRLVIGIACGCSLLALLATAYFVPNLCGQLNEIQMRVHDGVQAFRVDTDSAWNDLMELQVAITPPSKPRQNPFQSIFRGKRQLPDHCVCQVQRVNCNRLRA